jgi:hypothetical protein
MEYVLKAKKVMKLSISRLIIEQHAWENVRSYLISYCFDLNQKTVSRYYPLKLE